MDLKNQKGFTILEIILTVAIASVLAATIVPKFVEVSDTAKAAQCVGNQGAIITAGHIFYMDKIIGAEIPFYTTSHDDLAQYFIKNEFPVCPEGGTYTIHPGNDVSCSIAEHHR